MNRLTTAYAGSGDITEENAAAILNQLLPDQLGLVLIPKLPKRVPSGSPAQPGLRKAIKWLESEVGEAGTIPVDDLVAALLARSDYEEDGETLHDDLALVMVFDPDSEADVELANAAHDAGIRVVNLAAAGDDLVFEDEAAPETEIPAETVAGEEEEPPWSRPAEATAKHPVTEAVENATAAAMAAAAQHNVATAPLVLTISIPLGQDFIDTMAAAIVKAMGVGAQAAVAAAEAPAPEASVTHIGTKPVPVEEDPAGQPPNTAVYYYNTDEGTYRLARGKARATEQRVFLTQEQVQEVKDKRLLA